jgi:NADH dehydrogenase
MTTAIVGGGPTGVEMAGAVAELARWTLRNDFRRIDPRDARVVLIEAGPRLLRGFPEPLSVYAERALEKLGIEVRTGSGVTGVDADGVSLGPERIEAATVLWAAGVAASPAARWLGVELDGAGRVPVASDLSVPGLDGVYAIGDVALTLDRKGRPLPGLAQVAHQQGRWLGRALARNLARGRRIGSFRFSSRGDTAVIGRHAAVFVVGGIRFSGRIAWLLWGLVHIYLLVGFGNRIVVATQWFWSYLTRERGARLIE